MNDNPKREKQNIGPEDIGQIEDVMPELKAIQLETDRLACGRCGNVNLDPTWSFCPWCGLYLRSVK